MSQFQWACNKLICEEEQITSEQGQDIDGEALFMKWRWQARNYDHNGKRNTVKRAWELHQQWRFDQLLLDCHRRFAIKNLQILCYTSYKHEDFINGFLVAMKDLQSNIWKSYATQSTNILTMKRRPKVDATQSLVS